MTAPIVAGMIELYSAPCQQIWIMQKLTWTLYAFSTRLHRALRRISDKFALQRARLAKPAAAFVSQPEPRSYGNAARGLQMAAGNFLIAGDVVVAPNKSLWNLPNKDAEFVENLHGFAWLDDLAASDDPVARAKGQDWLFEWISKHGTRSGPGWRADVTGRRVVRWINHAIMLLNQQSPERSKAYFKSLGQQAYYLSKRWKTMRSGLPRFEALTGLVYCGLALEGKAHLLRPALHALSLECKREIGKDGGIASRNPEALMEVFTLLSWVSQAAGAAEITAEPEILKAIERMAPTLRALRLGDGGLVRFHGGGSGQADRLDQALADAGIRSPATVEGAMGYTRLVCGTTRLVMDTAILPPVKSSENAHACTLAFEMSSGQFPVLVNRGRSYGFSDKVREKTRATSAHNTLCVNGESLATFDAEGLIGKTFGRHIVAGPKLVTVLTDQNRSGRAVRATHDGYCKSHGLIHFRQLSIINNGSEIHGLDELKAETSHDRARFLQVAKGETRKAIPFRIHFHIHPNVTAKLDLNGTAISLNLPNEQVWVFRATGGKLNLRRSTYMERGRLRPLSTKQIVVTSRALNYEGRVTWTLTRSA